MTHTTYVLGSQDPEIARLDAQAASIAPATDVLLRAAGIAEGMRVLDLGTGLGHVARAVAEMVAPSGAVVGVDQDERLLEVARARGGGITYVQDDARTFRGDEPSDAIVARLLLFHLPDAVDVLHYHLGSLRPGGMFVALDFDIGSARSEPELPLVATALEWIHAAFRSAGADPRIGARLAVMMREAGYVDVRSFGVQPYLAPDDPAGPALLSGVVATLAPQIVKAGIATEEELGLDTLHERVAREMYDAGAVLLPPTVAGAWGRRA